MKSYIQREWQDLVILLRNIPSLAVSFFILSVVCMNLLANKELVSFEYMALDCGFTLSWFSFLCMDMICKRFGPKAAMKVSVVALFVNLCTCLFFNILSHAPGMWGEFYSYIDTNPDAAKVANDALNATFGGSWYVVLGSALAMFTASLVNSVVNYGMGKFARGKDFKTFAARSYVSTMVAQFVDNMIFALTVSHVFFGWTMKQVLICSITGAVMELLCEVVFSPFGYKMACKWEKENVGSDYFKFKAGQA